MFGACQGLKIPRGIKTILSFLLLFSFACGHGKTWDQMKQESETSLVFCVKGYYLEVYREILMSPFLTFRHQSSIDTSRGVGKIWKDSINPKQNKLELIECVKQKGALSRTVVGLYAAAGEDSLQQYEDLKKMLTNQFGECGK
jgi:hypothetical protein